MSDDGKNADVASAEDAKLSEAAPVDKSLDSLLGDLARGIALLEAVVPVALSRRASDVTVGTVMGLTDADTSNKSSTGVSAQSDVSASDAISGILKALKCGVNLLPILVKGGDATQQSQMEESKEAWEAARVDQWWAGDPISISEALRLSLRDTPSRQSTPVSARRSSSLELIDWGWKKEVDQIKPLIPKLALPPPPPGPPPKRAVRRFERLVRRGSVKPEEIIQATKDGGGRSAKAAWGAGPGVRPKTARSAPTPAMSPLKKRPQTARARLENIPVGAPNLSTARRASARPKPETPSKPEWSSVGIQPEVKNGTFSKKPKSLASTSAEELAAIRKKHAEKAKEVDADAVVDRLNKPRNSITKEEAARRQMESKTSRAKWLGSSPVAAAPALDGPDLDESSPMKRSQSLTQEEAAAMIERLSKPKAKPTPPPEETSAVSRSNSINLSPEKIKALERLATPKPKPSPKPEPEEDASQKTQSRVARSTSSSSVMSERLQQLATPKPKPAAKTATDTTDTPEAKDTTPGTPASASASPKKRMSKSPSKRIILRRSPSTGTAPPPPPPPPADATPSPQKKIRKSSSKTGSASRLTSSVRGTSIGSGAKVARNSSSSKLTSPDAEAPAVQAETVSPVKAAARRSSSKSLLPTLSKMQAPGDSGTNGSSLPGSDVPKVIRPRKKKTAAASSDASDQQQQQQQQKDGSSIDTPDPQPVAV